MCKLTSVFVLFVLFIFPAYLKSDDTLGRECKNCKKLLTALDVFRDNTIKDLEQMYSLSCLISEIKVDAVNKDFQKSDNQDFLKLNSEVLIDIEKQRINLLKQVTEKPDDVTLRYSLKQYKGCDQCVKTVSEFQKREKDLLVKYKVIGDLVKLNIFLIEAIINHLSEEKQIGEIGLQLIVLFESNQTSLKMFVGEKALKLYHEGKGKK